jgi:PAS domain S-box-containing protein
VTHTLADSDDGRSGDGRDGTAEAAPPMPELATESPKLHAFLLMLSERLRALDDPEQIQFESVDTLGRYLGAQRVGYAEDCGDGATARLVRHHADGVPPLEGCYRYADHGPALLRELRAGRPLVRPDIAHDATLGEPERRTQAALQLGATLHLPLLKAGRLEALLFVHYRDARPGLAAELALAESVASRTWEAVHRARAVAALRFSEEKYRNDITERQRTEAALRASEDRLRKAISIDTVGVLFFSLDGRVLDANAAFERMTGFALEELRRVHWQVLTPPEHLAATQRAAEELATRGETAPYEKEFLRKDGSRFWGLFAPTRLGDSGPAAECVEFIIDISAAKQVDRALREADRNKDEFLATLAHELRNPLAPLANGLHLVRLAGADNPRVQRTVEIMDRQLGHVVRLVDDLLDVARISMGKIELQRERVGLSEVIALAIEGMQAPLEQREQLLEVVPSRAELYVEGDRVRLTQVFSNLLSNALKYTQRGGRIQVRMEADGDQAAVSVSDTGIGIPGWALPHVFDLFSQVRIHQEQSEGGLGLGLSLVRSLVGLHDGTVSATSEGSGRGSTFTVRLPRVDGQWPSIHDSGHGDLAVPQPSGLHVLVADDNQDAAMTLASLLEFEGHHVQVAFDGEQAVASAQAQPPDVAFLDLGMPHMDGVEAARRLRTLERDRHMLIVALTGWGQDKDRDRTREAGFDAHLVKPPRLADLVDLMKRARH